MKNSMLKKLLFLILFSTSSFASAIQYTNFKSPAHIPVDLQNGTFYFRYNWDKGNFYCGGAVSSLLMTCLNNLNYTINTTTFNGEPIFGTANLELTCQNGKKSSLSVAPDIIKQPNQWITLTVPQYCG